MASRKGRVLRAARQGSSRCYPHHEPACSAKLEPKTKILLVHILKSHTQLSLFDVSHLGSLIMPGVQKVTLFKLYRGQHCKAAQPLAAEALFSASNRELPRTCSCDPCPAPLATAEGGINRAPHNGGQKKLRNQDGKQTHASDTEHKS